jgi:D-alanyl-D-alanine carboxypeptidase
LVFLWQYYVVILLLLGAPIDVQINRQVGLPVWYLPGESVEARAALEQMQAAAMEDGIRLSVYSGYRSYEEQREVFWREDAYHGSIADHYSARPGYSEHQLGTAYDVVWTGRDLNPTDDLNRLLYQWLESNAGQFGFIISYPLKHRPTWPYSNRFLPYLTDFIYEPWHIRYVGPDVARTMLEAGYLDPDSQVVPQDFYSLWKFSVVESSEALP